MPRTDGVKLEVALRLRAGPGELWRRCSIHECREFAAKRREGVVIVSHVKRGRCASLLTRSAVSKEDPETRPAGAVPAGMRSHPAATFPIIGPQAADPPTGTLRIRKLRGGENSRESAVEAAEVYSR